MGIFLSKYINKIDKKGRISVPAGYRSVLMEEKFNGIIVYPSFKNNCLEACGLSRLEELGRIIEKLDPYSDERDAFETVVMGESVQLQFDNEGRVILPSYLLAQVEITDQACFVGKGAVFEIWQPQNFVGHLQLARGVAEQKRPLLKNIQNYGDA